MAGILYHTPSAFDAPQLTQQPAGILDPRNLSLLNMGLNLMANSGPSLQPRSMGQLIGQAGQQGINTFMQARQMQQQQADADMRRKIQAEQLRKAQFDAQLQQQLMSGGDLSNMGDPDKMEQLGTALALRGHAGGATLISQAEKIRQRREEMAAAESFKSRPGILGAGVTSTSPQGQALLSNLTGDQAFDSAVLQAQNEALNSNTRLPAQPMQAPRPGLFEPLMTSPYVGQYAGQLQSQLDETKGIKPQQYLSQYDRLLQQHQTATNQAAARGENAALRRDLAAQADQTRRFLAGMSAQGRTDRRADLDAQREFTKERSLANDYNKLAEDFRTVLPTFESSAQYIAGKKYDSAGDRALIFSFARTLDPKDRVGVRDVVDINKLGNIPERMYQAVVGVAEGKMLPDRVRMDMFNVMRNRFDNLHDLQEQIEDEYETRARSYMLKPENVVQRYSRKKKGGSGGWSAKPIP